MNDARDGWSPYERGESIGRSGSEHGVIMLDDEHSDGARITLERDGATAPFAVNCGISGWPFVHTRFFRAEEGAKEAFQSMKKALAHILQLIPDKAYFDRDQATVIQVMHDFVERFP
jgi:hypothetical protein